MALQNFNPEAVDLLNESFSGDSAAGEKTQSEPDSQGSQESFAELAPVPVDFESLAEGGLQAPSSPPESTASSSRSSKSKMGACASHRKRVLGHLDPDDVSYRRINEILTSRRPG
jgi:hypothetical protein